MEFVLIRDLFAHKNPWAYNKGWKRTLSWPNRSQTKSLLELWLPQSRYSVFASYLNSKSYSIENSLGQPASAVNPFLIVLDFNERKAAVAKNVSLIEQPAREYFFVVYPCIFLPFCVKRSSLPDQSFHNPRTYKNPSTNVFSFVQRRQSADFEGLEMWNAQSGSSPLFCPY